MCLAFIEMATWLLKNYPSLLPPRKDLAAAAAASASIIILSDGGAID